MIYSGAAAIPETLQEVKPVKTKIGAMMGGEVETMISKVGIRMMMRFECLWVALRILSARWSLCTKKSHEIESLGGNV